MNTPSATPLPVIPPDAKRRAVLLMDSGSEADKELIDTFRTHVPKGLVDIIVVSTVPEGWNGDLEKLTGPAHPNIYNPWLFDSGKIDHLILVEEDENGQGTAIQTVADAIRKLNVDVRGVLPCPLQAWNEVGIAKLANELGMRHAPVASVETCQNKTQFNNFLRKIKEEYQSRGDDTLDDLLVLQEETCMAPATEQRVEQVNEKISQVYERINPFIFPFDSAKQRISDILDQQNPDVEQNKRDILDVIDALSVPKKQSGEVILKPADENGGSIGVVMISADDDAETIRKKIRTHIEGQKALGSKETSIQEFVEGIEVGYHGIKHGDEIVHELTMKDMTKPPHFKELQHSIPRASTDITSRREWELYQTCREKVFPVMEALFKELNIDISHLNTDIKITEDGQICILDAQLRTGLGVPKMLNAVYDDPDFDAKRMFMGMDLFSEQETDSWLCAKHTAQSMRSATPHYAAIVSTQFPEKSLVKAGISDEILEWVRKIENVFHLHVPDIFKEHTHLSTLTSYITIGKRPQIGTRGKSLKKAQLALDAVKSELGFRAYAIIKDDLEKEPEFRRFMELIELEIIDINPQFRSKNGLSIAVLQGEKLTSDDLELIRKAPQREWFKLSFAPNSASTYPPSRPAPAKPVTQRMPPRWDGENPPPYTFVRQNNESQAPEDERLNSSRPPTLREKRWQDQVKTSGHSRGQTPKLY